MTSEKLNLVKGWIGCQMVGSVPPAPQKCRVSFCLPDVLLQPMFVDERQELDVRELQYEQFNFTIEDVIHYVTLLSEGRVQEALDVVPENHRPWLLAPEHKRLSDEQRTMRVALWLFSGVNGNRSDKLLLPYPYIFNSQSLLIAANNHVYGYHGKWGIWDELLETVAAMPAGRYAKSPVRLLSDVSASTREQDKGWAVNLHEYLQFYRPVSEAEKQLLNFARLYLSNGEVKEFWKANESFN